MYAIGDECMGFSDTFIENILIIFITATLTGVLVPLIKARMDDRKFKEQKIFEAELARQAKIIESQEKLLNDVTQLFGTFIYNMVEVSYCKLYVSEKRYDLAQKKYDDQSWIFFREISVEISKAIRLTSKETYDLLQELYREELIPLDERLVSLIKNSSASNEEWVEFHEYIRVTVAPKRDVVIDALARELSLIAINETVETAFKR
jgi:hypothetical protein